MKKSIYYVIISLILMLTMSACSSSGSDKADSTKAAESAESKVSLTAQKMTVGSMKGPTTMGIINMMYDEPLKDIGGETSFNIYASAEELTTAIVKKEVDIALVPANLASVLYKKTEKGITVIDINTLGVLFALSYDESIKDVKGLADKTIYMTGMGSVPEYSFRYILKKNGIDDSKVDIHFCSESSEVISSLAADKEAVGILPQPFAQSAVIKDSELKFALDLNEEWEKVSGGNGMITGVTIVRNEYMEKYPGTVELFIKAHKESVAFSEKNLKTAAERIEEKDILKAAVVEKAYDKCHIVCTDGTKMKEMLSSYLKELFDLEPSSVGGELPDDGFYYVN